MKGKQTVLALTLVACLVGFALWGLSREQVQPPKEQEGQSQTLVAELVFSELCAKNETIIADNSGRHRDYAELYNGGAPISLDGFCLTDGRGKSEPFGDVTLASGEYFLVFLGTDLTDFSLGSSGGDCIQLLDPDGKVVAQTNTIPCGEDEVMVLQGKEYVLTKEASPGFANDEEGVKMFREGKRAEDPALVISEVLVQNVSSLPDENGQFYDAAELYNRSESPILLSDFYLSDSLQERFRYRLPEIVLPAGDYLTVFCDGKMGQDDEGRLHVPFGLSMGDVLCLTGKDGFYVDAPVTYPGEDVSLLLQEDGTCVSGAVSLGYSNDEEGSTRFFESRMDENAPLVISEVLLSASDVPYAGRITDVIEIFNRSQETVSTAGWFLSDGGDPYAYSLPQVELAPGECLVIPCSREETGFFLSASDTLRLTGPNYKTASFVPCAMSQGMQSLCFADGAYALGAVTLGFTNTPEGEQAYLESTLPEGLRISEMMSANRSYLKGGYAKTCDWIELYNASDEDILLSEYYLTDDSGELRQYSLPEKTLKPGEYWVALLADSTTNLRKDLPALPFTLSSRGETLYLTRDGEIVDYVNLPELNTDQAYGRPDGVAGFSLLSTPTPAKANSQGAEVTPDPISLTVQGAHDGVEYLEVELSSPGEIYYTTDCQRPGKGSTRYTGPIRLTETTVIRAIAYEDGKKASQVVDFTYVLNQNHALPVASLVTDPANLWDFDTGIYVEGPNGAPEFPHKGANYWQRWEKLATVSLFEMEGGGFYEPCGIRIFGAYSRALPIKAFSCFFRDAYGAPDLDYPLFGEEGLDTYESFIFRAGGQDYYRARMRDVLITSLIADHTTVAVQKYRPVVLYLNGKFWGVYFIREKLNENYVAGNYNTTPEEAIITAYNGGDVPEYRQLIQYVRTHDLSVQEHYDYVCSQVDIQNYMDYIIGEMWIGNADIDNIRFFKTPGEKWRWIMYDTDFGMWNVEYNSVADHLYPGGTGGYNAVDNDLIVKLLKNPEFKDAFLSRMAWQMNTIWTEETVCARIDELVALIGQDMEKDCKRWNSKYSTWQGWVQDLRDYVPKRNKYLLTCIQDYFNLSKAQMRDYGFQV